MLAEKKQVVYSTQKDGRPAQMDMSYLSEKSEMPLFCLNEEGIFESISPCAAAYFKSTPEQMMGKNINDLLSPDVANHYMEKVRQTLMEDKRLYFADPEKIMSQNHRFHYFWPLSPENGQSRRVMIMVFQLTEEKHAEMKLSEANECIEQIVKMSAEPIMLFSDRIIHMVNESFAGFFGYSIEELIGKDPLELVVAPQDRQRVIRLNAEGFCGTDQSVAVKKDGTIFPCEVLVRKIRFKGQDMRCCTFRLLPRQPLSKSEKQVLELIMQGLGNKQIARKICRSIRTVEVHRSVLMKKYEAESIVDLVKKAIGIIPPPPTDRLLIEPVDSCL